MRRSLPVKSADEIAEEHRDMRDGLAPAHARDLDAYFEAERKRRWELEQERQARYDRKMV